jgi:hypothetical protein
MPRQPLRDAQGDFRGGLNLSYDEDALAPNEVRRAEEAVLTEYGAISKRLGTQRLMDTGLSGTADVQNGFAWLRDNGTQQLLAIANGTLYTASYGIPTTWTSRTGTPSAGFATTGAPAFASFRDGSGEVVYIADGGATLSLNKWNGTSLTTDLASTPGGITSLAVYNQRLFGCTGVDQKIYWSALNNGDSLGNAGSGGGEAVIRTFGDQNITGLAAFRSSLLVFHVSGISRFTGLTQDDIAIAAGAQGVTTDVGAIATRSIVNTPEAVYFLSDRGFYVATEAGVAPISLKIDTVIQQLDLSNTSGVIGVHNRAGKEVWWYLPGLGLYRYNYALQAWTGACTGGLISPTATTAMWEAIDAEKQPIVLIGDEASFVKQADKVGIYKDNVPTGGAGGTAFSFAVRCKRMFHGDTMQMKAYKWAYVTVTLKGSATAGFQWKTGNGSEIYTFPNTGTIAEWGTGTWGLGTWGAGASRPYRIGINGYGQYIDILLTDDGDAQSVWSRVEIDGFDYGRRY